MRIICAYLLFFVVIFTGFADSKFSYDLLVNAGKFQVGNVTAVWTDTKRSKREIPVRIYYPKLERNNGENSTHKKNHKKFPVVIFSHGLGGSRNGYRYLGKHWASHGVVSVHLQHPGSDENIWKPLKGKKLEMLAALKKAAFDPRNMVKRPRDDSFVIDKIIALNDKKSSRFYGYFDINCIGVAGHSFGALTSMAVAGKNFTHTDGKVFNFADKRVTAVIAMSTHPHEGSEAQIKAAWEPVQIPMFVMTGSEDTTMLTPSVTPEMREQPFEYCCNAPRFLLNLDGAEHFAFSDRKIKGYEREERHHQAIKAATTSFWMAMLNKQPRAVKWLEVNFKKKLTADDKFLSAGAGTDSRP